MKKLFMIMLALCLALSMLTACGSTAAAPAATEAPAETDAEAEVPEVEIQALDFDKIYAAHSPEEIVANIGGEDISWDEYFSWLRMGASEVENYMTAVAQTYGETVSWSDMVDDSSTFEQYVTANVETSITQLIGIEQNAEKLGFVKDAAFDEVLAEQLASDIATVCGEGATEEEFYETIKEAYMSAATYARMNEANATYAETFKYLYGEDLEKLTEETVMDFISEIGYMNANHILFMTIDPATNEKLDDATIAEKKAQAEEIRAELASITDNDRLVARFLALKEEFDEDTGKVANPEGYIFTPGTMVPEFEVSVQSMKDYQVSDLVETVYGYHIIMRLPIDSNTVLGPNSDGSPFNGRILCASNEYGAALAETIDSIAVEYAEGFSLPKLSDYIA